MTDAQTTYERATSAYDEGHERALMEAITRATLKSSMVSDANAIVIRTAETAAGLADRVGGHPCDVARGDTLADGNTQNR